MRFIAAAILITFVLSITGYAQQCRLSGTVRDAVSDEPLAYAHVYIKSLDAGTTSDGKGRFTMPVPCGEYNVRASYMGYSSAVRNVTVSDTAARLVFELQPSTIEFPEITVVPGENPAIPIIRKAIAAKRKVEERLHGYSVDAHTKLRAGNVVVEAPGFDPKSIDDGGVMFVAETHSTAYWSREEGVKEVIRARKQAVAEGEAFNTLNSMPARTNFSDDVVYLGKPVPGPISEEGLDDYWYELKGTTVYDGEKVYIIDVHPESELAARMDGRMYIQDSTYLLMRVNMTFTEAVFGPMIKKMRFRQQFTNADGFWMPSDVAITANVEGAAMVNFSLDVELFSVLKDYRINADDVDAKIDDFVIEVAKGADDVDSTTWAETSFIPQFDDEVKVYGISDSLNTVRKEDLENYEVGESIAGTALKFDETTYILPGVFSIYRFNKVEGHALNLDFIVGKPFDPVETIDASLGYGFSDERFKWSLGANVVLHERSWLMVSARAFDDMHWLDEKSYMLAPFPALFATAVFEWDPRDFFYQKGYEADLGAYVLPWLHANAFGGTTQYFSAKTNTDEHLFRSNTGWPPNGMINDGRITTAGLDLRLDTRSRILNKGEVQRWGSTEFQPELGFATNMADIAGEQWTFNTISLNLGARYDIGGWGNLECKLEGLYSDGKMPTQSLFTIDGSLDGVTGPWLFRSFTWREFGGDRLATAMVHWNLGNLPFRAIGIPNIPYLNNLFWSFTIFGNGGWTDMTDETAALQLLPVDRRRNPFYELGFSIGEIFTVFQLDFAWRMNHFVDGQNFFWGISIAPDSFLGE